MFLTSSALTKPEVADGAVEGPPALCVQYQTAWTD